MAIETIKLKPLPPLRRGSHNASMNPKTEVEGYEDDNSCNHFHDAVPYNHVDFTQADMQQPACNLPTFSCCAVKEPDCEDAVDQGVVVGNSRSTEEESFGVSNIKVKEHAAEQSINPFFRKSQPLLCAPPLLSLSFPPLVFSPSSPLPSPPPSPLLTAPSLQTRFKSLLVRGRKVSPDDPFSPPPRLQKRFSTDSSESWISSRSDHQRDMMWSTETTDDLEEIETRSTKKDENVMAEKKGKSEFSVRMDNFLGSKTIIYMNIVCTMWILCGDDVYILINPPLSFDQVIFSLNFACFIVFFIDFFLRICWEHRYLSSFYFWLDFISLLSLLPDVIWFVAGLDVLNGGKNVSDLARSGRAASAGARVARIIRILQLLSRINRLRTKGIAKFDNELGDNSVSELAKKLDTYISMHVVIAVGTTLVLSFSLSAAYSFKSTQCLLLAMRGYSATLEPCMRGGEVEQVCLQRWKETTLQDLIVVSQTCDDYRSLTRFVISRLPSSLPPSYSLSLSLSLLLLPPSHLQSLDQNATVPTPLIYLELSNIVLYGSDQDYLKYRQKPRTWSEVTLEDLPFGNGTGIMRVSVLSDVENTSVGRCVGVVM
eukprot:767763-Hanusia_phi.AAC.1